MTGQSPTLPVGRVRDDTPVLRIGDGSLANWPVHPPQVGWRACDGQVVVFGVGSGSRQYTRPDLLRQQAADLLAAADWLEAHADTPDPVCKRCNGIGRTPAGKSPCGGCAGTGQVETAATDTT